MKKQIKVSLEKQLGFVPLNEKEKIAYDMAVSMYDTVLTMTDRYREFCIFCRNNISEPKRITAILLAAGFTNDVASRIKTIAMSPKEVFEPFATKQIGCGFNPTLDKARDEVAKKRQRGIRFAKSPQTAAMAKFNIALENFEPFANNCPGHYFLRSIKSKMGGTTCLALVAHIDPSSLSAPIVLNRESYSVTITKIIAENT